MKEPMEATRSARSAEVLDPAFVDAIHELPLEELRRRRDEAVAEREFLSYFRRLLQVREDVLKTERAMRQHGGEQESLMDRLTRVLSEGPRSRGRGEALRVILSQQDMDEAERKANEAVGEAWSLRPESLDDQQLEQALITLEREERAVSELRTAVFRVHDQFQEELKRRFQENPSQIGPV